MFRQGRDVVKTRALALGLMASLSSSCASGLNRKLARGDLAAVQKVSPERRSGMSNKQARRYAEHLAQDGQTLEAQLWWLGAYLRGADLKALEALASSEALAGEIGFAAAHFAEVVASRRDVLRDRALACRVWRTRMQARYAQQAYVGARKDQERLRLLCAPSFQTAAPPDLKAKAKVQAQKRVTTTALISSFPAALMPSFLNPAWRAQRLGQGIDVEQGQFSMPATMEPAQRKASSPAAQILDALVSSQATSLQVGRWIALDPWSKSPQSARLLLDAISADPTLGSAAAAWTALLARAGHTRALEILRDKLRASASLISAPSARFRVILALGQQDRESSIFWMRLGASEMADQGAWWLWCARWAELLNQRDAARVAYQSLATLVVPQSPARRVLSWWRLRQRVLDLEIDPYLRSDAPNQAARASVRALWEQFVSSLPERVRPSVWPSLTDTLVLRGWGDAQIQDAALVLLGPDRAQAARHEIAASRAKVQAMQRDPRAHLNDLSVELRRAAWHAIWSSQGTQGSGFASDWDRLLQDSALSPRRDPLAALTVLFSGQANHPAQQ